MNAKVRGTTNPAPNFDRMAALYRWMEWFSFGPYLRRCRCAFLDEVRTAKRALVLGDGDGRFTAALLRTNPTVQIDAVDTSPAMLHALLHRAGMDAGRVRVHAADAREWVAALADPGQGYNLAVSHFFLDCLTTEEVFALATAVRRRLSDGGCWIVSDFAIPDGLFGQLIARPLVGLLYFAFGLLTGLRVRRLPNHASALRRAGFTLHGHRSWLGGLLCSEMWRLVSVTDPR